MNIPTPELEFFNEGCESIYLKLSGIEDIRLKYIEPIKEFHRTYAISLSNAIETFNKYSLQWLDFSTTTQSYSAKWLQPFTVFYPILFQEPFTDDNIDQVNNWVRKFFPIKNADGTLNYIEHQKLIVNCYTYNVMTPEYFPIITEPKSWSTCATQSGNINLHCQSLGTGGWVHCSNGTFNCNETIDCYPTYHVDCWFSSPYLNVDGSVITTDEPILSRQTVKGQIQANLYMEYNDRATSSIKTMLFEVSNCDWAYSGPNILL